MLFNVEEFAITLTKSGLNSLLKTQLKQLVEHLHLTVESSATKATLRKVLREYFIEEDLMSDDLLSDESEEEARLLVVLIVLSLNDLNRSIRQEKERECHLKLRELELREKEMNTKMEVELKEKELALRKEELKEKGLQM